MTETASLVIAVDAKGVNTATDDLKKLAEASAETEGQIKAFGDTIRNVIASLAIGSFIKEVIQGSAEAEQELAQLNATLKSTGEAAGLSSDEVVAMAEGLEAVTTFSAGAIISMESQLLTFTKIGKTVVPQATEAILDLATKMGGDLKGAAVQVGKALNDPVLGITALSKVGVSFTDSQREVIKSLVETGNVASAQKIILAELAVEFGGSARAARDTFGGALTSLQNSIGNLLEGSGGNLNEAKTAVEELNTAISDPRVKDSFATITAGILGVATAAAQALPAIVGFSTWVGETLAAAVNGPAVDDLVRTSDAIVDLKEKIGSLESNTVLKFLNTIEVRGLREELAGLEAQYETGFAAQVAASESQQREAKAKTDAIAAQVKAKQEELKRAQEAGAKASEQKRIAEELKRAQKEAAADAKKYADATAAQTQAINNQVSSLQFQAETVGKSKDEVTLLKLALDGATESQLASAQAALGTVAAYDAQAEAASNAKKAEDEKAARGKAITQESLSDLEVLAQKQQGYYDALQEGSISQEVFNKVSAKNSEAMRDVANGAGEATGALDDFAKTAQENIQSQLADNLTEGFNGSFRDILSGWGQLVQRMIAEAAAAQLTESLFGALGVGGAKGGAGGAGALASIGSFFSGFFDNGGNIPAGKFGIAGEKGMEIVQGPATVTSTKDTAKMMGGNTIIINQPGVSNTREAERSAGATRRAVYGAVNSGSRYA